MKMETHRSVMKNDCSHNRPRTNETPNLYHWLASLISITDRDKASLPLCAHLICSEKWSVPNMWCSAVPFVNLDRWDNPTVWFKSKRLIQQRKKIWCTDAHGHTVHFRIFGPIIQSYPNWRRSSSLSVTSCSLLLCNLWSFWIIGEGKLLFLLINFMHCNLGLFYFSLGVPRNVLVLFLKLNAYLLISPISFLGGILVVLSICFHWDFLDFHCSNELLIHSPLTVTIIEWFWTGEYLFINTTNHM